MEPENHPKFAQNDTNFNTKRKPDSLGRQIKKLSPEPDKASSPLTGSTEET